MNIYFLISIVVLAFVIILICKVILYPRFKRWLERRKTLNEFKTEKGKLLGLEHELLFHLNWAKERGDSIALYEEDLCKIRYDIKMLNNRNPEVELSDI